MAKKEKTSNNPYDEDYDRWGDFPGNPLIFNDEPKKGTEKKAAKEKKRK